MFMRDLNLLDATPLPALPATLIPAVFSLLDSEGIGHVLLDNPNLDAASAGRHIDCYVDARTGIDGLARLLKGHGADLGAPVVHTDESCITFECSGPGRMPCYVRFHFRRTLETAQRRIATGEELLAGKRRQWGVWLPSAAQEFRYRLIMAVVQGGEQTDAALRLWQLQHEAAPEILESIIAAEWTPALRADILKERTAEEWALFLPELFAHRADLQSRLPSSLETMRSLAMWRRPFKAISETIGHQKFRIALEVSSSSESSAIVPALEKVLAPFTPCGDNNGLHELEILTDSATPKQAWRLAGKPGLTIRFGGPEEPAVHRHGPDIRSSATSRRIKGQAVMIDMAQPFPDAVREAARIIIGAAQRAA